MIERLSSEFFFCYNVVGKAGETMAKIMLIEDDRTLAQQVKEVLEANGYEIIMVEQFSKVEEQFIQEQPDMVILDINLPHFDGNYYCRIFRRQSKVPILITSARNSDMDQIFSMELGADDYLVKPFHLQMLIAKVNALFRRSYGEYAKTVTEMTQDICGIHLDEKGFKVTYAHRTEELSKNEYKLLKKFLEKVDEVIPREELLEELWDESSFVDDNTLTVNVTRLKGKLGQMGMEQVIKTKRGVGYIFDTSSIRESES